MQKEQFLLIWEKYLLKSASEAEIRDMLAFMRSNRADSWLQEYFEALGTADYPEVILDEKDWQHTWAGINQQINQLPSGKLRRMPQLVRRVAAAAIVVAVATGAYFWLNPGTVTETTISGYNAAISDIAPGKEGAILTLADGKQVVLDSLGNGVVANQNGVDVVLKNGQIAYNPSSAGTTAELNPAYNMISTPRGRQFNLELPDGSKVWLNAASSIRYPVAFTGKERKVDVTGEAYFEVVKNAAKPFKVYGGGQKIQVLGTSFNVNFYEDEPVKKTSLLSGSLKVSSVTSQDSSFKILAPGQQATYTPANNQMLVQTGAGDPVAWKNNIFNFHHMRLPAVMRQLSRWYDIEVIYENGVPDIEFWGKIGRDLNLSQILTFLEKSDVHCRMENERKLIIRNQP